MGKRISIECAHAASLAVKLANVDVIAAYPITPQTHIVERLAEYVANGELDAEYINVESEHSAMSACIGASAAGARVYTSTAGQGLALMHEMLFIAAGNRLPIVMGVANRSLSPNLNIWGDQSDMMASRDCGWIQIYAENAQEVFDHTLQAFKIAEDERVLLPVAVCFDGFHVTHVIEPLITLDQEEVDRFLPKHRKAVYKLTPDQPSTWGPVAGPDIQTELKVQNEWALNSSKDVILEVWREFGDLFGRYYAPLETYKVEDADAVILILGGFAGTGRVAIDKMREEGKKIGLVKLRLYRPFPIQEVKDLLTRVKAVAVVDRAISAGGLGGPVYGDIRNILYDEEHRPKVLSFIAGLGGRDITVKDFKRIGEKVLDVAAKGHSEHKVDFIQVRI
ncbi:MAG: hypothetical protein QXN08_06695 [Nitrososphaerales archaeon]